MTNKESVEKARQKYKVVLSEIKELLKEKPYPKEAIDNKIKERDNLSKKLDDLIAEPKGKTRIMINYSNEYFEEKKRQQIADGTYKEMSTEELFNRYGVKLTEKKSNPSSSKESWLSDNWFYIVGAVILILLFTQIL